MIEIAEHAKFCVYPVWVTDISLTELIFQRLGIIMLFTSSWECQGKINCGLESKEQT